MELTFQRKKSEEQEERGKESPSFHRFPPALYMGAWMSHIQSPGCDNLRAGNGHGRKTPVSRRPPNRFTANRWFLGGPAADEPVEKVRNGSGNLLGGFLSSIPWEKRGSSVMRGQGFRCTQKPMRRVTNFGRTSVKFAAAVDRGTFPALNSRLPVARSRRR